MKTYKSLIIGLAVLSCFSCSDFLDEVPDNRVEIDNIEKAAQLVGNAYNPAAYLFTDWMSDNAANLQGVGKQPVVNDAFRWGKSNSVAQDSPEFFWNGAYGAIAHANEVLSRIDDLEGDAERKQAVKGEALMARAYNHFLIASLFSKVYNPQTASSDLGIPYVTEPERELLKSYARGTVAETYAKIERDLLQAIPLLNAGYYEGSGKYHFSRKSAWAFASRFYLFMGRFDKVLEYANLLLGDRPDEYVKDLHHIYDIQNGGSNLSQLLNSPDEEANLLLQYKQTVYFYTSRHGYGLSSELNGQIFSQAPYGAADVRRRLFYNIGGGAGVLYPKYEQLFERENLASETGLPTTVQVELRGEEVLFNRMEASLYLWFQAAQAGDEVAAQEYLSSIFSDLNSFFPTRYDLEEGQQADVNWWLVTTALALNIDPQNPTDEELELIYQEAPTMLLRIILDEKRKEFVQEGMRWWDNLRYGMPITHITASGEELVLLSEDPRRVIQIPETAIDLGMTPNPR